MSRNLNCEPSGVQLAVQLGVGLAFWPLLLLASSTLDIRWTAAVGRGVAGAMIVAALILLIRRSFTKRRLVRRFRTVMPLLALAALSVATRWSQIRSLVFPPWVDSLHHAMIVRLIAEQGAIPSTLDPIIPGASFYYHWGYHATAAWLMWLLGMSSFTEIPRLLLGYGQMLNAITVITMYGAGRALLKSREAGLTAAALACFISLYPAYYLSWGRYTHLAGTLMLPALLIVLWRLASSNRPFRVGAVAVILTAGLALVHVRIAFFAAVFMLVCAILKAFRPDRAVILRWLAVGSIAAVIVLPWFTRVIGDPSVQSFVRPSVSANPDLHQTVPLDILFTKHNRELLALATCGVTGIAGLLQMPKTGRVISAGWWLLLIWAGRHPARDARARRLLPWRRMALVGAVCAVTSALLLVRLPWLDLTRFASVSSAAITLFLPLSLAGAALIPWFLQRTIGGARASLVATLVAFALAIYGATKMVEIVNPVTRIAETADARALAWIEARLPPSTRFAVDAKPWMSPSWVGVDGGYWIGVSTSASSILPPSIYAWSLPAPAIDAINEELSLWSSRDPSALDRLQHSGVTHVYTGARSAPDACDKLRGDRRLRLLYRDGPVCVFQITKP